MGSSARTRTYAVSPKCGGSSCSGSGRQTRSCNNGCCPVNCEWETWGNWSSCSVTCGNGSSFRNRTYAVSPKCGGASCDGISREIRSCNTECCPVDCQWEKWSAWESCSATCGGGVKIRIRDVEIQPKCGGTNCPGSFTEIMSCNTQCCPAHCQWSSWDNYSPCSVTCGTGYKIRTRQIAVSSICNGTACVGGTADIAQCSMDSTCHGEADDNKQPEISGDINLNNEIPEENKKLNGMK